MLKVDQLVAGYGKVEVLHGISLEVQPGQLVTLIGSNGAGKTTTLRVLSGMIRPASGSITLGGTEISGLPAHAITRKGLAHSPEGRRVFSTLSVSDNLQLGAFPRLTGARPRGDVAADRERMFEIFPRLKERRAQLAGTLSGGEQQMLAIGRALMSKPRLLLLDEPSLGLAPLVCRQIFGAIRDLNRRTGLTVLLVEQNAYQALRLAHRGYVLVNGAITLAGTGAELLARPEVKAAYLEGAPV